MINTDRTIARTNKEFNKAMCIRSTGEWAEIQNSVCDLYWLMKILNLRFELKLTWRQSGNPYWRAFVTDINFEEKIFDLKESSLLVLVSKIHEKLEDYQKNNPNKCDQNKQ